VIFSPTWTFSWNVPVTPAVKANNHLLYRMG
jgi:hypothetical protein